MSSIVEDINKNLSTDWPGELWDEYGRQACAALLHQATPTERAALLQSATMQAPSWQTRLLSVLSLGDQSGAISLAISMLERPDEEVVLGAGDLLRSLQVKKIQLPEHARQILNTVAQNSASRIDRKRAAELLRLYES